MLTFTTPLHDSVLNRALTNVSSVLDPHDPFRSFPYFPLKQFSYIDFSFSRLNHNLLSVPVTAWPVRPLPHHHQRPPQPTSRSAPTPFISLLTRIPAPPQAHPCLEYKFNEGYMTLILDGLNRRALSRLPASALVSARKRWASGRMFSRRRQRWVIRAVEYRRKILAYEYH